MRSVSIATLSLWIGSSACAGSAGFSGGSSKAATPPPAPAATPTITPADQTAAGPGANGLPKACGAAGVTLAQLLTSQVSTSDANSALEYQLTLSDCQGNAQVINVDSVLFDFDGTSPGTADLDFSITDGGSLNYTGKLRVVHNTDLFGRTGTTYQHYQSDNTFKLQTSTKGLHIRVAIGETGHITQLDGDPSATTFQLPTYLRLGEATPVEKDVTAGP